jgi:hypothetical protein
MSLTLPLHRVLVDRERAKYVKDLPEHEITVLRAVHGPQNVITQASNVGQAEFDPDPELEYDRLARTYRRTGGQDPMRVFVEGPESLRRYGFGEKAAERKRAA